MSFREATDAATAVIVVIIITDIPMFFEIYNLIGTYSILITEQPFTNYSITMTKANNQRDGILFNSPKCI